MAVTIEISQTDLTYAKEFIKQYLTDKMPEADFSEGTGLVDLTAKAISYVFAFIRSEITKVETLRSLAKLKDLDDDDETMQAVDDIISNFFLTRGGGSKAKVTATHTLSQRVDVFIGNDTVFNRDGTHNFYPIETYTIDKENLIEVVKTDGTTVYEFDTILEAENIGKEYEVVPGRFIDWGNYSEYVIDIRNDQAGSSGDEIETNSSFIARSDNAITVRNLVNPKSINVVLLDKFKDQGLKDVVTIGYGDPELQRDIINTNVTWTKVDIAHIGNHQDIYVALPLVENQLYQTTTYIEHKLGEPDRNGTVKFPQVPIYKIHSIKDRSTGLDVPYTLFIRDYRYMFTEEQEFFAVMIDGVNGRNVDITYDTVEGFDLIHAYLRDPEERITLANSLARARIPIYVEINIKYTQIEGQPTFDESAGREIILTYIDSLTSSDILKVDSIVKGLHNNFGEYISVSTPLIVKGTVFYPNATQQVFYSENMLTVPEYPVLGVTNRVCSYYCSNQYITFTKLN